MSYSSGLPLKQLVEALIFLVLSGAGLEHLEMYLLHLDVRRAVSLLHGQDGLPLCW